MAFGRETPDPLPQRSGLRLPVRRAILRSADHRLRIRKGVAATKVGEFQGNRPLLTSFGWRLRWCLPTRSAKDRSGELRIDQDADDFLRNLPPDVSSKQSRSTCLSSSAFAICSGIFRWTVAEEAIPEARPTIAGPMKYRRVILEMHR